MEKRQAIAKKQKDNHDRSAKIHPPLKQGFTVRVNDNGSWPTKAKVVKQSEHPRSYHIQTEEGRMLRRIRRDLLQTKETFHHDGPESDIPVHEEEV